MVKTKIIATLGPASATESTIRKMTLAGMDVVRINFSHSRHEDIAFYIKNVRAVNKKYRRHVRVLGDLEGPRIRIGRIRCVKAVTLKKRQIVWFEQGERCGEKGVIPLDYKGPLSGFKTAQHIYIDDGTIVLKIKKVERRRIRAEVVIGGLLKEYKGVNVPGARLLFPPITEKDKRDIEFAMGNGFDYIAQSFVRGEEDVLQVQKRVRERSPGCMVVAKIENRDGVKNIDKIIRAADGIMIARGDMGVCLPIYEVPLIQKLIIKKCNLAGRFVITATQMLESMVEHVRPTRAEVTDVANAILDGTDYVMLSAETAVGRYPVESVKMMNDIIKFTEKRFTILKQML